MYWEIDEYLIKIYYLQKTVTQVNGLHVFDYRTSTYFMGFANNTKGGGENLSLIISELYRQNFSLVSGMHSKNKKW